MSQEVSFDLGGDYPRSRGVRHSSEWLCPRIHQPPSNIDEAWAALGVSDSLHSSRASRGIDQPRSGAPCQGGYSQGSGSIISGLLQQHLYAAQEKREVQTHHQSERAEQLHRYPKVQDGNSRLSLSSCSARGLGCISRPDGCLSSHPNSSVVPEVPQICGEWPGLPVCLSPLRFIDGSSGVHQDVRAFGDTSSCTGYSVPSVFGRPFDKVSEPGTVRSVGSVCTESPVQTGPRRQFTQVRSRPESDLRVHRGVLPHSTRTDETSRRQDPQYCEPVSGFIKSQDCSSVNLVVADRPVGVGGETGTLRETLHSTYSLLSSKSVCSGSARTVPSSHSGSGGFSGPQLVVAHGQSEGRSTVGPVSSGSDPLHRRQSVPLGGSCSRLPRVRSLDVGGESSFHQLSGALSSDKSTGSPARVLARQESACGDRQHLHSGLHQPPGGNPFFTDVGSHLPALCGGSPVGSGSQGSSHSGQDEQACGPSVKTTSDRQHRVDSVPRPSSEGLGPLGQISDRSDGHISQQSVTDLRQSDARSSSLRGRRNVLTLDRHGRVHLSAVGHDPTSSDQAPVRDVLSDSGPAPLAEQIMVSTSAPGSHRLSKEITSQKRPDHHAPQRAVSRASLFPGSARMSTVFDEIVGQGFSREVSKRAASSGVRDSSNRIYDSRWERYSLWCYQQGYDPVNASLAQVADFFLHLFDVENRAPVTIEGYRTAINTVWNPMGRTLNGCVTLDRLFRSFKLERPRSVHTFPRWDLNLVLRFIKRPEYHADKVNDFPLFFSGKVAFLVLLASARRCGDIHAIDPKRITITKTAMILTPYPGYLPKALAVAEGRERYEPIVVRNLSAITSDPDELLLCPVLALRAYHSWAESRAPRRSRFFVSTRLGAGPVVKATLSSWVKKLIRRAYENANEEDAALASTSVHELRALAASLAVQATFAIEDVVKAATWSTPSIFASYYLRDVSGLQGRLHVIGPCIAAGKILR